MFKQQQLAKEHLVLIRNLINRINTTPPQIPKFQFSLARDKPKEASKKDLIQVRLYLQQR